MTPTQELPVLHAQTNRPTPITLELARQAFQIAHGLAMVDTTTTEVYVLRALLDPTALSGLQQMHHALPASIVRPQRLSSRVDLEVTATRVARPRTHAQLHISAQILLRVLFANWVATAQKILPRNKIVHPDSTAQILRPKRLAKQVMSVPLEPLPLNNVLQVSTVLVQAMRLPVIWESSVLQDLLNN